MWNSRNNVTVTWTLSRVTMKHDDGSIIQIASLGEQHYFLTDRCNVDRDRTYINSTRRIWPRGSRRIRIDADDWANYEHFHRVRGN